MLWPFSMLYCGAVEARRCLYQLGILKRSEFQQPVLVVGNITVGGTGKTPLTIWLANYLKASGYQPGIISRGYGRNTTQALSVQTHSAPDNVGDEPLLMARRTNLPVAVAAKRSDAVNMLLNGTDCNIFISDDGLQHLALKSDLSIALVNGDELFGNAFCLPAGPLREPKHRFEEADMKVCSGSKYEGMYHVEMVMRHARNLCDGTQTRSLESFRDEPVNAVAGIRNPQRFFNRLRDQKIEVCEHPFQDHYRFTASDFIEFDSSEVALLMTEKDAVKCSAFARPNWWAVELDVVPEKKFTEDLKLHLSRLAVG